MTRDFRRLIAICAFATVTAATHPATAQDTHAAAEPSAAQPQVAPVQPPSVPVTQPASPQPAAPQPSVAPAAPAPAQPLAAQPPQQPAPGSSMAQPPAAGQPAATQSTDAPAQPPAAPPPGTVSLLPQNLSPWGMFLNADIVVKAVICALAFASILTWTIWLVKTLELMIAKRRLQRAFRGLRDARSLTQPLDANTANTGVARALLQAAREEWQHSADALDDRDGLKERIALHLQRVEAAIGRHMMVGTGVLATIGSTAPFVGLFGTVWGIMNSFIGISKMHTTNLAVVAPGIAEALLATAIGLVAAIPAVIIYNHFARQISSYKAQVADAGSAVLRLASRDLSRGVSHETSGSHSLRMVAE